MRKLKYHVACTIDEVILKVNPVLFSAGIPLFAGASTQNALELLDSKIYSSGVVLLQYNVKYV